MNRLQNQQSLGLYFASACLVSMLGGIGVGVGVTLIACGFVPLGMAVSCLFTIVCSPIVFHLAFKASDVAWRATGCIVAFLALASTANATHPCYVQKVVVPQYVAVPIVQNVYYQVGSALQLDAIVDARVRAQLQAMQAQQQAPPATAPATAPATHPTTPPPDTGSPPANVFVQNCAKCHTGATPKGGLTLDGITPIPPESGFEILRRLQLPVEDKDHMPPQVDLPPADKGKVLQELFTLTRKQEEIPTPPIGP